MKEYEWERVSPFTNSEQTKCGRAWVQRIRNTSGMATRWDAMYPGGVLKGCTTKAIAKHAAEYELRKIDAAAETQTNTERK